MSWQAHEWFETRFCMEGRRKYLENPRAVEKLTYLGAVTGSWQRMTPGRSWHPEPSSGRQNLRDPVLPASIARGQQDLPLRRKSARIVSWQDLDSRCPTSVGEFQTFHLVNLVNVYVAWQGVSAYDFFASLTRKSNTYQTKKGPTSTIPMCSSAKCTAK